MNRLRKIHYICAFPVIALGVFVVWFLSTGIQLQPTRPTSTGWQEIDLGDGYVEIGSFVLTKGASTDNGKIGVMLLDVTSKPCPFATICVQPDAKATLRFYRPSDKTLICESNLSSSSTSYLTSVVCPGLPFTNIRVSEINTRDDWALISFVNLDELRRTD